MNWECDRCGTVHTQNAVECRSCGHQILSPISDEEAANRSGGIDSPEALSDVQRTGRSVEPEYESSPGVSVDGSVAESSAPDPASSPSGPGFDRRVIYKLRGTLLAPFKLLREWIIPITIFLLLSGGVAYFLI